MARLVNKMPGRTRAGVQTMKRTGARNVNIVYEIEQLRLDRATILAQEKAADRDLARQKLEQRKRECDERARERRQRADEEAKARAEAEARDARVEARIRELTVSLSASVAPSDGAVYKKEEISAELRKTIEELFKGSKNGAG